MRNPSLSETNRLSGEKSKKPQLRLLFWAILCSVVVGVTGFGDPVEDLLRDLRNLARPQSASGQIVVVGIDGRSLSELENWPWPRRNHATITDNLRKAGAREIFFDLDFSSTSDPQNDEIFRRALAEPDAHVVLPARDVIDPHTRKQSTLLPIKPFRDEVELASINAEYNFRGHVRSLPFQDRVGETPLPSLGARLARVAGQEGQEFPIDFAIDPRSVPILSAVDVLKGNFSRSQVEGKTIVIGATSSQLGDAYHVPGHGMLGGLYLQVLGAETLLAGPPLNIGWLLPLLAALAMAGGMVFLKDVRLAAAYVAALAISFMLLPIALENRLIFADIVPSLLFLVSVSAHLGWSSFKLFYRARGSINAISGLPNLNVLRQDKAGQARTLIVAKVQNYAEIASALSAEGEETLVHQIAHRLTLIAPGAKLYQSDEGIFAWFEEDELARAAGEYLHGASEIFRNPMLVLGSQVDTTVTFGIDTRTSQPLASRLGSALVAADEALRGGLKWKQYDPSQTENMAWKLSLLSQLDQAIDEGALWIAFQPKMDLASRRIVGAEALARWDHPEKGAINPTDFILAAEQSGRIGKLTDYVLGRSIQAAAELHRAGIEFNVAVNLSARLIDGMALTATVSRLLAEHQLPPQRLTLEITETAALAGGGKDFEILTDLRAMGVQLSIDDYGTGLSTLDYMKRIPATEIKIDKSFIEAIEKSRSDRLMVHSTIQLAHSLGQKVVAEGVERVETLEMLALMGCDVAQGYLIGYPLPIDQLQKQLVKERRAA